MNQKTKSRYGLFNHFVVSPEQKETAKRFGLNIEYNGNGIFNVSSAHGEDAFKKIASPFTDDFSDGKIVLQRKDLKAFLNFLRQPIANSTSKENRKLGHAVTRFITTGHVKIEKFLDEGLASAASLECHEKGERKMKEADVWKKEPEFWNPEMNSETVSSIPGTSYDPDCGFVFHLDKDFVSSDFIQKPYRQELGKIIKDVLLKVKGDALDLNDASIVMNAEEVQEFYKHIESISNLETLVTKARIEEKAQAKVNAVLKDAQDLKEDPRFQLAVHARDKRLTDAVRFDNLIQASTALTPYVQSEAMFDSWRNSYRTEYWMNLSNPVQEVFEELQVFNMAVADIRNSDGVDAEHLQALIHNFRPLIAFVADLTESLEEGAGHKKVVKALPEDKLEIFKNDIPKISSAFAQASVNGVQVGELDGDYEELLTSVGNVLGQNGSMAKQQLEGYKDMMVGFWQGVGDSVKDEPWVAAGLAGLAAYAWYVKTGLDAQAAQQAVETVFTGIEGGAWGDSTSPASDDFSAGGFTVSDEFLDSFAQNADEVIDEAIQTGEVDTCLIDDNCHYNYVLPPFIVDNIGDGLNAYLKFRHYIGSDIIASNANTAVGLLPSSVEAIYTAADIPIEQNTVFRDVSYEVTYQGGLLAVDANMFQDGSHLSMYLYGIGRTAKSGFGGFKGMGGLAAEFFNPAYRITQWAMTPAYYASSGITKGAAFVGGVSGVLNEERSHKMMNAASAMKHKANPRYAERLVETAMTRMPGFTDRIVMHELENEEVRVIQNANVENISLNIGWYGLKSEQIQMSEETLEKLEKGLNEFALVLKYSAEDIGIESESYTEFVLERLEALEDAIKQYKVSEDANKLEILQDALNGDLQHVIGAELKFNGRDQLYRMFFPKPDEQKRGFLKRLFMEKAEIKDDRRYHVLARHASKKEGKMIRAEQRIENRDGFQSAQNRFEKPETLFSKQSLKYAWGQVEKLASKVKYTGKQALNHVWGSIVFGAREGIQEPFNQIPNKGKLALTFAGACMTGLAMDVAGVGNSLSDAFSAAGAAVSGASATALWFGLLNIPQDLALHTVLIASSALAVGVPWYYAVNRGAKPMVQGISEKLDFSPN